METYKGIPIEYSLKEGDCLLYYEIIVRNGWCITHCICPLDKCSSIYEAIDYYFEKFHKPHYRIIKASFGYYSKEEMFQLCLCC